MCSGIDSWWQLWSKGNRDKVLGGGQSRVEKELCEVQSPKGVGNKSRTESEAKRLQLKSDETPLGSESGDRRQKLEFGVQGESLYGVLQPCLWADRKL